MLEYLPSFDYNLETYLFLFFALFASIQFLFVFIVFGRLAFHRIKNESTKPSPSVSVIIAARNDSENLYNNLPFILDQNYDDYEVIVVNHQSIDDSKYILEAYQKKHSNLHIVTVERSKHLPYGKKLPLTLGIRKAKYEHLLFTDADCLPTGKNWITSMANKFTSKKQIVLGYGPYKKEKGFLNAIIRFDTAWIAMNYFSLAKTGLPYMGIGRNLAYTKSVFDGVHGFKSHYSISSGDDDLFIQEAAKKRNYTININPESYTFSLAPQSWSQWFNQKSRHYTTSERYKVIKKMMLGIYPMSLLLMTISFVILLFDPGFIWLSLAVYVFLFIVKWIILGKAFKKLGETKFIALLPLLDLFYAVLAPGMYYAIDKKQKDKW